MKYVAKRKQHMIKTIHILHKEELEAQRSNRKLPVDHIFMMADDSCATNRVFKESDAFFEILRHKKNHQTRQVHRLEDLLSPNQKRGVRQIAEHPQFRRAFEKLAGISGIRSGMLTGSLHKFTSVRCDEVCILSIFLTGPD
ncbi:hypothetical protein CABS01_17013 [Colletotrichum abscissum]|uniref:uncharacterized protein n=1 Tax=Colletotrichum abscissum TaxID=1671311 RepID=UPI0027D65D67|nr:uncharacterized protein CABS01_17013 [Colletotrichum abscissum]KAK1500038.1 hypothetical protein CABS01_17013 [Colletotrichum abscissum]